MAGAARHRSEKDQQIDEALEGFMDAFAPRLKIIFLLILLVVVFAVFMLPTIDTWGPVAGIVLFFAFQLVFAMFFMIVQFGALFWFLGRGRTYWVMPGETGITFADYRGNPEVLEAARRIVVLLRGVKEFKQMGGEHIRGLLLAGPPGTGKSYLAQAISTEAGVPFGYISAPSMTSMFMGIGNIKVMMLYGKARKLARKHGACIIFIDEIDAIGMARSSGAGQGIGMMGGFMGGGGTGLLNELLMQMDPPPTDQGWKSRLLRVFGLRRKKAEMPAVLTCAATNLVEVLDQALLRPGRFDRKIRVEAPDATGRRDILLYYLAKVAHEPDIDVDRMVNDTMGYTPVAIKYVLNEAAVHAHFDGRTIINYDDFTMARDTHEYGIRQPVKAMAAVDKRRIAYHEAGHTVAQIEYAGITRARFAKVTLMRYGNLGAGVGGFSSTKPTEESVGAATSKEEILAHIKISLASRAAEEQFLGTRLNGVGGDFHSATELTARYLYHWGMAETIVNPTALFGVVTNQVVADNQMQDKVERVLQQQMLEVKQLLERRSDDVIAIAEALIARDELNSQDVEDLLRQVQDEKVAAAAAMAVAGGPAVAAIAPAAADLGAPTDRPTPPLSGTTAAYQPAPPPTRNDESTTIDGERPEGRGGSDD